MSINIPILLLCGTGVGLVFFSDCIFYTILGEVNARSPEDQQISMFGVNTKLFLVLRRHNELFPHSRKRFEMPAFFATGVAIGLAGVIVAIIHYST